MSLRMPSRKLLGATLAAIHDLQYVICHAKKRGHTDIVKESASFFAYTESSSKCCFFVELGMVLCAKSFHVWGYQREESDASSLTKAC